MINSSPRPWQRQPGESAADFNAFVTYLRLKGRRSVRSVAAQAGRSPPTLRRLSAQFNWPGRVLAFEERLAEAKQEAVDALIHTSAAVEKAQLEKLRLDEFSLAQAVLRASDRWLAAACNPRRRLVPLAQVARLIESASKLGRLAAGMPTGDEKPRSKPEPPGYWTQPSVEEALEKIYGADANPSTDQF